MTPKNAILVMKSMRASMSPAELKISDAIVADPAAAAHMSIAELAGLCGASRASIVNFCRKIGFGGFKDLKMNIASCLRHPEDVIMEDVRVTDSVATLAAKVFGAHIRALEETASMLDSTQLQRAVDAIAASRQICFYGVGTSASIAQDAYYRFMRIGLPAAVGTDPHISLISADNMDKDCVAVGISHSGRTRDLVRVMETAKEAGATVIAITSHIGSHITRVADISLIAYSSESNTMKEAISARAAHVAMLDCLYICAALKKHGESLRHIDRMLELLNQTRYSPNI